MKKIMLILVCLMILTLPNPAGEPDKEIVIVLGKSSYIPYQEEYEKLLYPTVRITAGFATGSGVIFTTENTKDTKNTIYILTACHVVDNQSVVNVELYDSRVITASVVITDTVKDLALLSIEYPASTGLNALRPEFIPHSAGLYAACLAPRDYTPYLFCPVWAVGCSLGLDPRPSYGHITHIEKSNQCSSVSICGYEISAPILPGNSGGPVFDARTYEVIGIAVWVHTYQGQLITTMGGVVPINQIYEFLEHNNITKAPMSLRSSGSKSQ
ncbi:MAG: serine protease [Planctomycetota bacterium]